MHILSLIQPKPEYVFRPSQIVRRLGREISHPSEYEEVTLPWGLPIRVRPRDTIGSCIWRLGVYELSVSEALHRLVDPGELAVDVGAHIGYMTSIMAIRVGPQGKVLAFEPHPATFDELIDNTKRWASMPGIGSTTVHRLALSDSSGVGILATPGDESLERGTASLVHGIGASESRFAIDLRPLSEFIAETEHVGVIKIDVEGHEHRVLRGALSLLERRGIRDVIFEDFRPYPTESTALLKYAGYSLFSVGLNFWGLVLDTGGVRRQRRPDYIPTYLATTDPNRAMRRLRKPGWASLRSLRLPRHL